MLLIMPLLMRFREYFACVKKVEPRAIVFQFTDEFGFVLKLKVCRSMANAKSLPGSCGTYGLLGSSH